MAKESLGRAAARWERAKPGAVYPLEYGPGFTGCPAVSQAIEQLYAGQSEESFWALISALNYALEMGTEVLVPVDAVADPRGGAVAWAANPIPEDKAESLRFWTLRSNGNKTWLPLFTTTAAALKDRSTAGRPMVQKKLRDMMELALDSDRLNGVVIDPWGRSATLECALLNGLVRAEPSEEESAGEREYDMGTAAARAGDWEEAFRQYQASAELGCAAGERMLGQCFKDGAGTQQNMGEALRRLESAAAADDVRAVLLLGDLYAAGAAGTRPDPGRALMAYRRAYQMASRQPDLEYWPEVCLRLAQYEVRYISGDEALRLAVEARHGLRLRTAAGDCLARKALDEAEALCRELAAPQSAPDSPLAAYSTEPSQLD